MLAILLGFALSVMREQDLDDQSEKNVRIRLENGKKGSRTIDQTHVAARLPEGNDFDPRFWANDQQTVEPRFWANGQETVEETNDVFKKKAHKGPLKKGQRFSVENGLSRTTYPMKRPSQTNPDIQPESNNRPSIKYIPKEWRRGDA